MKNLFNKKITPCCEYCIVGIKTRKDTILCAKYGITNKKNSCKKFKYDPLKRIPKKQKNFFNFKIDDFLL